MHIVNNQRGTEKTKHHNMETVLPECPICLQVFNNDDTIPRVLSCGHSACEACLPQLPQRFPNTIRCPACNQLVKFPTDHSPSSLPKNIDLLSFINQQTPTLNFSSKPSTTTSSSSSSSASQFLPPTISWSEEFYTHWRHWVLEAESVMVENSGEDPLTLLHGILRGASHCRLREGDIVSLLYLGSSCLSDSTFNFSYIVRVMQFLKQLKDVVRDELSLVLRVSRFRISEVYGLWMNSEDGTVFLVCGAFNDDLSNKLRNGIVGGSADDIIPGFAMVAMELCEALAGLHADGLISGCFALSCFSFAPFSRIVVCPNEVLVLGRKIRKCIGDFTASGYQTSDDSNTENLINILLRDRAFVSPEILLLLLRNEGLAPKCSTSKCSVGCFSDVWSLACILISILLGDLFTENSLKVLYHNVLETYNEDLDKLLVLYMGWVENVSSMLDTLLGSKYVALLEILCRCLEYDPGNRPNVTGLWECIRGLVIKPKFDILVMEDSIGLVSDTMHCLTLGNLCDVSKERVPESRRHDDRDLQENSNGSNFHQDGDETFDKDIIDGLRLGKFESIDLHGHLDCITGLAVGGDFLFGSSFDKAIHVWSLQDFSHVHSFRGHEHRVMGVVYVDAAEPLCISGDSGGGIFVWGVGVSLGQEPLKKWYEQKDWRYSGIHALAVSGTDHIYTGSGDQSIKAWSLRDYTLTCTMSGHKSVVSSLAVCDGVLYSGSWDGTIRLWSINDHSLLTVLGDDTPGNTASVLSVSADHHLLAAAHENGCVKLWRNDVLSTTIKTQGGGIFAVDIKEKWLFMGGWNKTLDVKEVSGDDFHIDTQSVGSIACGSVITALLYWKGKLFIGFADRIIKVYEYKL